MSENNFELQLEKNWKDWFLIIQGLFYFTQGVAIIAIIVLQLLMIDEFGLSETQALSNYGTIMLPWGIKFVYGIVSDNVSFGKFGRRRPYIVLAGLAGLVGWIWIPFFETFNSIFMIVAVLTSLTVALSDAVLDSLAVDITPQRRRGAMQGVGWGMRGLGSALAGITFGVLINKAGWFFVYLIPGILVAISCIAVLFYPEPVIELKDEDDKIIVTDKDAYFAAIKRKGTWVVTIFMILSGTGITVVAAFTSFLKSQTSLELDMIGLGITIFALGQFVGAAVIGLSGDYLPLFPVLAINTIFYGIILGMMFILASSSVVIIYLIVGIIGAINGGYEATQMRIGMEYSVGVVSGSLYNWYMSISNLGQLTLGAWLISGLAKKNVLSFPQSMQIATIFLLLALVPAWIAVRKLENKKNSLKSNSITK